MQEIKKLLPKAVATLEPRTKANPRDTRVLAAFEPFLTLGDPKLEKMKSAAIGFADDMIAGRIPRWLSLLGVSGIGKTMLARIIWRLFRDHLHMQINWPASRSTQSDATPHGRILRHRGGFINWGDAINGRMLKGDYDFLDDMRAYSFFAIDDIASEYDRHRELSASKLYNVFEGRLRKWTVITANLSLDQIGSTLDARIASRMLRDNGIIVDVDTEDFNLREKS